MGLKGKLIASMEMKCGGDSFFDTFHTSTHYVPNLSPTNVVHFEIHEGEIIKPGSIVSWRYNEAGQEMYMKQLIESVDTHKKSIKWKAIEGDLLKLYNYFNFTTSGEGQWATWTVEYEKKTEDTPEPLVHLGVILAITKDIEGHLVKK
ncbi:hypothetical protein AABB24_027549 [Solanum stoloniferum]|uniref:Bet v I/Major latex protein domain-containing protein n=1 Tax=Solanum stoloniferum TaxID=62892 RepID=A0ABD2S2L9_9SOLN